MSSLNKGLGYVPTLFYIDADGNIQTINRSIKIGSNNKIYFRDLGIYIYSPSDSILKLVADTQITLSAPTIFVDEYIKHAGAETTYIKFEGNRIEMLSDGGARYSQDSVGLGFFGVTEIAQVAHLADPTDLPTCITAISTLIDNLKSYGLMAADP